MAPREMAEGPAVRARMGRVTVFVCAGAALLFIGILGLRTTTKSRPAVSPIEDVLTVDIAPVRVQPMWASQWPSLLTATPGANGCRNWSHCPRKILYSNTLQSKNVLPIEA
jgi:hypothetical protein